ncbi:MAG: hypothetical protein J6328_02585 [Bacilli bacterium]|nr:hypothetical protein [Bacilli bacterium]
MGTNENRVLEFIESMADLLHEVTRPLYRKRSEYPVDEVALYENTIQATALFDRYFGYKPTEEQAMAISTEPGSYQRLIESYEASSDQPAAAITEYCGAMNGVIDERAFSKNRTHFIMTPNLYSYAGRIEELLLAYKKKSNRKVAHLKDL